MGKLKSDAKFTGIREPSINDMDGYYYHPIQIESSILQIFSYALDFFGILWKMDTLLTKRKILHFDFWTKAQKSRLKKHFIVL